MQRVGTAESADRQQQLDARTDAAQLENGVVGGSSAWSGTAGPAKLGLESFR
jgi:hypothetical protein